MQQPKAMTIRELPKSKKTSVDELHPMLKVQRNVITCSFRNLRSKKRKKWVRLLLFTVALWL